MARPHEKISASDTRLEAFIASLREFGKSVPCKGRECFRCKLPSGTATITPVQGGFYSLTSAAYEAWKSFEALHPEELILVGKVSKKREGRFKTIAVRDGAGCFYCGTALTAACATIEHLVPRAHSGPGNLKNLALACEPCNKEARDLSVAEKVRLRDRKCKAPA